jgi:subtilisin-like proprotein convertase family protein
VTVVSVSVVAPVLVVSNGAGNALTDNGVTTSQIHVGEGQEIHDVSVVLTIEHQRASDLDVFLVAPDGTRVKLFDKVGGNSGQGWQGTELDDEAGLLISANQANPPYAGAYKPEESLSALDGGSTAGTWTLEIKDTKNGKTGTLISWSMTFVY